jgi:hypothetical protein
MAIDELHSTKHLPLSIKRGIDAKAKLLIENYLLVPTVVSTATGSFRQDRMTLNEKGQLSLRKVIDSILNNPSVSKIVSKEFLEKFIYKWLDNKEGEQHIPLFEALDAQIEVEQINYTVFFPVLHLTLHEEITSNDITIGTNAWSFLDSEIKKHEGEYNDFGMFFRGFKTSFNNQTVLISCDVKAEFFRAKEIAYEKCSLFVDALRICTETLKVPFLPLHFNIERKTAINETNREFVRFPKGGISAHGTYNPRYFYLSRFIFESHAEMYNLNEYLEFAFQDPTTELRKDVINCIKAFSSALGNENYSERVAQLFSILESIFLGQNPNIGTTLYTYVPRMVTNDYNTRLQIIDKMKELYTVRSQWVHHRVEKLVDFGESNEMFNDIAELQQVVHTTLRVLMKMSTHFDTKAKIIEDIDKEIASSYRNNFISE